MSFVMTYEDAIDEHFGQASIYMLIEKLTFA